MKQLLTHGIWQVPESERPPGWQQMKIGAFPRKLTKKQAKKFYKQNRNRNNEKSSSLYRKHIGSDKWKAFRDLAIKDRDGHCERCFVAGVQFHVHHKTYDRLGHEDLSDVEVLCVPCHALEHLQTKR